MASLVLLTDSLCKELQEFGAASVSYPASFFSGKQVSKPDIKGRIKNKDYRVITFEASEEHGIANVSVHFTMDITSETITEDHIAYWNAENRFSKMYKQDDDILLVMDQLLVVNDTSLAKTIAKLWMSAVTELSRFKSTYERMKDF